jgi:1,4-alpha-glucan branching enzyme
VLPLSHDEVVHLKRSLLGKMSGDRWQQFANLRLLYSYQWTFPGKKLLFMGGEFGQLGEWNANAELDWRLLQGGPYHLGLQRFVEQLNRLYQAEPALWKSDYDQDGFHWIDCSDNLNSVLSFLRQDAEHFHQLVVIANLTPVSRMQYRIGLPRPGRWRELLNSDAAVYGGSNTGNLGGVEATENPCHGQPCSAEFVLPPLSILIFRPERARDEKPADAKAALGKASSEAGAVEATPHSSRLADSGAEEAPKVAPEVSREGQGRGHASEGSSSPPPEGKAPA